MRLAVFTKNRTNPAYDAGRLGAERAAALLDASVTHYVPEIPDDPDQQCALIDQALATRPDAFAVACVHATRIDPAILRVAQAGIPLVAFIQPITVVPTVSFVGADDVQLARELAHYLFRHLGGEGRVLVVTGPEHSVTSLARLQGFREAAAQHPGIDLAGPVAGDYDRGVARARVADWLRGNAGPDACLIANDIMAMGVLETLQAAGHSCPVVGVNAIPEAITAIGHGRMLATADFNAMQMAYTATECAIRHLRGEAVPARIDLPVDIVDRTNWSAYDRPYAQRTLLTLEQIGRNQ
jgi:ribose transport system substrate-binding protein